jgi:ferredoxin
MAQIFHPSMNTLSKVSIFGSVFFLAGLAWIWAAVIRSPYVTEATLVRPQPVAFSHKHHVGGLGIDCRYCHTSVEKSPFAGIPPTKTCMTCHSQIWTNAEMLEPVRESFRTDRSIEWTRLHDLPDFAYFNHSIHVAKGVGCSTCHGRVDQMPLMWKENTLDMEWCLACHRAPENYIRPRSEIFNMSWQPPPNQIEQGLKLLDEYKVSRVADRMTDCYICHR